MNRVSLVNAVAGELDITKKAADEAVIAVLQGIMAGTVEDSECAIQGFGKFSVKIIEQRNGHNPATGEAIVIPQHRKIVFKPGIVFKSSLA